MKDREVEIIPLTLVQANKTIPAIVPTRDSEAKRDGKDLIFMTCSLNCATLLKSTFQKEKEIINNVSIN
jgi:hypothetical protein